MENDKIKERAISELDKIEESGFDLGDWSIEDAYVAGYQKGLETKINTTTISDCPLPDGDREAYIKKLLQSDIDKHNKIAALSRKVYDLQKQSDQLTEAKEIIKNILRVTYGEGWNYSLDWKVKAEAFLKE